VEEVLVDSNVLLDVLTGDPTWYSWSARSLSDAADQAVLIGAHAAVAGIPLLTRDARRYRSYFPKLRLIAPGGGGRKRGGKNAADL
jgi:predicted nucleic acid-binding protein